MKKDNFFVKLKNNIYNMSTFQNYVKDGFLSAILYALILSLILGGIKGFYVGVQTRNQISESVQEIKDPSNEFSIKNGELSIKRNPTNIDVGNTIIYVDSNIDLKHSEELRNIYIHGDSYILVLKDGLRIGSGEMSKDFTYKTLMMDNLNNEELANQLNTMEVIIVPVMTLVNMVQHLVDMLLNCLMATAIAIIIGTFMGLRMKVSAIYSLAIYASTLPSLILLPLSIVRPYIMFDVPFVIGTTIYMIFILKYIKNEIINNIKL
ncbi:DUF1189 family protein [Clostridium baratii]|uniref:DUF1189 family protein n=1 Tax=Clostridium baratii TaxID=1561 RepID=UPI0030D0F503